MPRQRQTRKATAPTLRRPLQSRTLRSRATTILAGTSLEAEDDSGLSAEIVLGAVADDEAIAEAGADVINLHEAERNMFAEGQVEAAADDEIKSGVVRQLAEVDALSLCGAGVVDVAVNIIVGSSDHNFRKGLEMLHVKAQNRANRVREHAAAHG